MAYFEANLRELPDSQSEFNLIPAGWYEAQIEKAELCQSKKGGEYIKLMFSITGPTHANRKLFANLNVKNDNPKAEEIGRRSLGEIMRAIGISRMIDTDELINNTIEIKVSCRINNWQGEKKEENVIKAYRSLYYNAVPSEPAALPTTAASNKPLWMK